MTRPRPKERCCSCTPVHVTEWENIYVEGGVLYVVFWSGGTQHAICMGPAAAMRGIGLAQKALIGGGVVPMVRPPEAH